MAQALGIELPAGLEIIDPDLVREDYVAPMVELRKAKGMTPEQAMGLMDDVLYFGVMMVKTGGADGIRWREQVDGK